VAVLTVRRIRRLGVLDLSVLDEVGTDPRATLPSLAIAGGSMLMLGVGGWLWWIASGLGDSRTVLIKSVLIGSLFSLALWLAWLLVVYIVLHRLTDVTINVERLVRAAGMASAPLALGLLMAVPMISFGVGLVAVGTWALTTQAAIERATGLNGRPVVIANAAGFAVWAIAMSLLATSTNQIAPGPFLAESIWDAVTTFDYAEVALGS
jgi:hypothetical protein